MQECTLYLTLPSLEELEGTIRAIFEGFKASGSMAKSSFSISQGGQSLRFACISSFNSGKKFKSMMNEMHDFYAETPTEHTKIQEKLLAHIKRFNIALAVEATKDMDDDTFGAVMAIADAGDGLIFLEPSDLYTVEGDLLFNADGESDLGEAAEESIAESIQSYLAEALNAQDLEQVKAPAAPSASSKQRAKRCNSYLKELGIPTYKDLPPLPDDENVQLRGVQEIAERTIGILMAAIYAEFLQDGDVNEARDSLASILEEYDADGFFSPAELDFIDDDLPEEDTVNSFLWRYECCWIGMWALGFVDETGYPAQLCDAESIATFLKANKNVQEFIAKAKLRPLEEVLEEAELIYRMDTACINAAEENKKAPANLDEGVVAERWRMLIWLLSDEDWDDLDMDDTDEEE